MHVDPKKEVVKSRGGQIGLALLLIVVMMAIFAPLLATDDPLTSLFP